MVQIKGSAIKETIDQIKRRAGDPAFQKILGRLDDETREVFEGKIFSSTWYPLDLFTRFLEIEIKVLADSNEEMVTRGSEAVIERQLRGIYKVFVKLGSPEFVIKRIAAVHATYFQGVPIDVKLEGNNRAFVRYTGFEKTAPHHGLCDRGILQESAGDFGRQGRSHSLFRAHRGRKRVFRTLHCLELSCASSRVQ